MTEIRAHTRLKRLHPKAHWQRFESWSGVGVFDSNGCLDGMEVWVEFKQVIPPKNLKDTWVVKPKVRKSQIAWQALREKAGGRTFVALLVGPTLYILPGAYIRPLQGGMELSWVKEVALDPTTIFNPHVQALFHG